jgi:hypothetical protein
MALLPTSIGGTGQNKERRKKEVRREIKNKTKKSP